MSPPVCCSPHHSLFSPTHTLHSFMCLPGPQRHPSLGPRSAQGNLDRPTCLCSALPNAILPEQARRPSATPFDAAKSEALLPPRNSDKRLSDNPPNAYLRRSRNLMIFQVLRFSPDYNTSSRMAVTLPSVSALLAGLWLKAQASLSSTSDGFHWTTCSPL